MSKRKEQTPTLNYPKIEWKVGDKAWHVINNSNWNARKEVDYFHVRHAPCTIVRIQDKGCRVRFENGIEKFCLFELLTKEVSAEHPQTYQEAQAQ